MYNEFRTAMQVHNNGGGAIPTVAPETLILASHAEALADGFNNWQLLTTVADMCSTGCDNTCNACNDPCNSCQAPCQLNSQFPPCPAPCLTGCQATCVANCNNCISCQTPCNNCEGYCETQQAAHQGNQFAWPVAPATEGLIDATWTAAAWNDLQARINAVRAMGTQTSGTTMSNQDDNHVGPGSTPVTTAGAFGFTAAVQRTDI